jgi:ABC-2 type transport system ATP-binding protein
MTVTEFVNIPSPTLQPTSDIIEVTEVNKRFGKNPPVLENISFKVKKGEIFCLLGPSGSGKSTILRLLTGFYKPDNGQVKVLATSPSRFGRKHRNQIGYLPQQFVLFPELSVEENMNFVASLYGVSWIGRGKRIQQALDFVELWPSRHKLASQVSGGMLRRLELASTLVHQPQLIFMDEPTAGVDPILRAKFWEHFKELREEGRTLFVTTQYVTEADYCDQVAILSRGHLLAWGSPEEIRRKVIGGELVNLEVAEVTGQIIQVLRQIGGTHRIQTLSSENVRLTVDNASESLQEIISQFKEKNIVIKEISPYRPTFDEVFVQLMEQDKVEPKE